jgi:hypothetical protein
MLVMRLKTLFFAFVRNFLMFALRCWVVVAVVPLAMFARSPGWISVGTAMVLSSFRLMHMSCSVAWALFLFALVAVWFRPRASTSAELYAGVVVF